MRRLIEVAFPVADVSNAALQEQQIRWGHPHHLHIYWACRPLAVCRAAVMATFLPDPADPVCPAEFRRQAAEILGVPDDPITVREALTSWVGKFSVWENGTDPAFLHTARRLIEAAYPDGTPSLLDPFAGLGSIPIEGLRAGLRVFAGDLNPLAVILETVLLKYIPTYGRKLSSAVERWGNWLLGQLRTRLREIYPIDDDGAEPYAYYWLRTIRCDNPECGATLPLIAYTKLWGKKRFAALLYDIDRDNKRLNIRVIETDKTTNLPAPFVDRFRVRCPVCGYFIPYERTRELIAQQNGGTRNATLVAVARLTPDGKLSTRSATAADTRLIEEVARTVKEQNLESLLPGDGLPSTDGRAFRPGPWGFKTWADLYTPRQVVLITTLFDLVRQAYREIVAETGDPSFSRAVAVCLALIVSHANEYYNALCRFTGHVRGTLTAGVMASMLPAFGEANPLIRRRVGGFEFFLNKTLNTLHFEGEKLNGTVDIYQGSATKLPIRDKTISHIVTDPPFYDTIIFSCNSDVYIVWLRQMLKGVFGEALVSSKALRNEECVADPERDELGSSSARFEYYTEKMTQAFRECRRVLNKEGVMTIFYAHKHPIAWAALFEALHTAGWEVTRSWVVLTEKISRIGGCYRASLSSNVLLVCRPIKAPRRVVTLATVKRELKQRLSGWVKETESAGINAVDLIYGSFGPALEILSRYEQVLDHDGVPVTAAGVRNKRGHVVRKGVFQYAFDLLAELALNKIPKSQKDAYFVGRSLLEMRKRRRDSLPYKTARRLLKAAGLDETEATGPGGFLTVVGKRVKLTPFDRRQQKLFMATTLDRIHHAMTLVRRKAWPQLRAFLTSEAVTQDRDFWPIVNALCWLYPGHHPDRQVLEVLSIRQYMYRPPRPRRANRVGMGLTQSHPIITI